MQIVNAEHWESTHEEYHASPGVSNSRLSVFLDDPELYRQQFVARTHRPERKAYYDLGTATHEFVLLGFFTENVVRIPDDALTSDGKKFGNAWNEFVDEHRGKILLKDKEFQQIDAMAAQVLRHPVGRKISQADYTEYNIRGTHGTTGMKLRCRIDVCGVDGCDWDLKTTTSVRPEDFTSAVIRYGYHRQQYLYRELSAAHTGERRPFRFVAVRKSPPYRCDVFELDDAFDFCGEQDVEAAIRDLAECYAADVWHPDGWGRVHTLRAPGYLMPDVNLSINGTTVSM